MGDQIAGFQRPPHRAQVGHGVGEEHRAEAREDEIVIAFAKVRLGVATRETDVRCALLLGPGPGVPEESVAAVDSENPAAGPDPAADGEGGAADVAANAEYGIVETDIDPRHHAFAVGREAVPGGCDAGSRISVRARVVRASLPVLFPLGDVG